MSRYRLQEQIAVGGTGQVWRATDAVLSRVVAVKLLRPEYAEHTETLARFRAEAQHAARLAHPGIVRVYDYGQAGPAGTPFLVMELVDGPSLASVLAGGPLHPSSVLDMIGQVAGGLAAAHAAGLVHRDIKPANLLLAPGGVVKITDFGIASAVGSAPLTGAGMLACTPGYLAPERAAGAPASPAGDLYSLGVVAWEALAGRPPFTGNPVEVALAHAHRDLPPLPARVPAQLAGLVAELTAKDPASRPASAVAVAARVGRPQGTVGAAMPSASPAAGQHPRPPATLVLSGITIRDAVSFGQRLRRGRGWPGRLAVLAATGVIVAAGLAAVLAAGTFGASPAQPAGTGPSVSGSAVPDAPMVTVDAAALDGQQADTVLRQLRRAGLRPSLVQVPGGGLQPGTVVDVQPAGQVPAGTVVTVTAAASAHDRGRQHDGHSGDGTGG